MYSNVLPGKRSNFLTPGLGMGLYIASEIIKEHKGEIKVKSKLNKGSVFSFLLPLIAKGIKTIDDYPLN